MTPEERRITADRILYDRGLLNRLAQIGTPHVIGSCRMDMMSWNDLDIDVENDGMSREKLYDLTTSILKSYHPLWYEAKEEIDGEGKTVWFHGFEAMIDGELWNFDIWFFSKETIAEAEAFCDRTTQMIRSQPGSREAILTIKQELIGREMYGLYTSMDVYRAVLDQGIRSTEEFLAQYRKQKNRI